MLSHDSRDGVWTVDANGSLLFINPVAERLLGWKTDDLQDKHFHDVVHGAHGDACPLQDVLRVGRRVTVEADRFARRDGTTLTVSYTASPVAQEGLVAALQARLAAVEGRIPGPTTTFDVQDGVRLPAPVEEALHGIAQETLNNVFKHARASRVALSLRQAGQTVTLQIADDGVGFDPTAVQGRGGLGLGGMAERAAQVGGRLTVQSSPGQGTSVRVEVPL